MVQAKPFRNQTEFDFLKQKINIIEDDVSENYIMDRQTMKGSSRTPAYPPGLHALSNSYQDQEFPTDITDDSEFHFEQTRQSILYDRQLPSGTENKNKQNRNSTVPGMPYEEYKSMFHNGLDYCEDSRPFRHTVTRYKQDIGGYATSQKVQLGNGRSREAERYHVLPLINNTPSQLSPQERYQEDSFHNSFGRNDMQQQQKQHKYIEQAIDDHRFEHPLCTAATVPTRQMSHNEPSDIPGNQERWRPGQQQTIHRQIPSNVHQEYMHEAWKHSFTFQEFVEKVGFVQATEYARNRAINKQRTKNQDSSYGIVLSAIANALQSKEDALHYVRSNGPKIAADILPDLVLPWRIYIKRQLNAEQWRQILLHARPQVLKQLETIESEAEDNPAGERHVLSVSQRRNVPSQHPVHAVKSKSRDSKEVSSTQRLYQTRSRARDAEDTWQNYHSIKNQPPTIGRQENRDMFGFEDPDIADKNGFIDCKNVDWDNVDNIQYQSRAHSYHSAFKKSADPSRHPANALINASESSTKGLSAKQNSLQIKSQMSPKSKASMQQEPTAKIDHRIEIESPRQFGKNQALDPGQLDSSNKQPQQLFWDGDTQDYVTNTMNDSSHTLSPTKLSRLGQNDLGNIEFGADRDYSAQYPDDRFNKRPDSQGHDASYRPFESYEYQIQSSSHSFQNVFTPDSSYNSAILRRANSSQAGWHNQQQHRSCNISAGWQGSQMRTNEHFQYQQKRVYDNSFGGGRHRGGRHSSARLNTQAFPTNFPRHQAKYDYERIKNNLLDWEVSKENPKESSSGAQSLTFQKLLVLREESPKLPIMPVNLLICGTNRQLPQRTYQNDQVSQIIHRLAWGNLGVYLHPKKTCQNDQQQEGFEYFQNNIDQELQTYRLKSLKNGLCQREIDDAMQQVEEDKKKFPQERDFLEQEWQEKLQPILDKASLITKQAIPLSGKSQRHNSVPGNAMLNNLFPGSDTGKDIKYVESQQKRHERSPQDEQKAIDDQQESPSVKSVSLSIVVNPVYESSPNILKEQSTEGGLPLIKPFSQRPVVIELNPMCQNISETLVERQTEVDSEQQDMLNKSKGPHTSVDDFYRQQLEQFVVTASSNQSDSQQQSVSFRAKLQELPQESLEAVDNSEEPSTQNYRETADQLRNIRNKTSVNGNQISNMNENKCDGTTVTGATQLQSHQINASSSSGASEITVDASCKDNNNFIG